MITTLKTLALTHAGMPTTIIPAKRALSLVGTGRAMAREWYDDTRVDVSSFITSIPTIKRSRNTSAVMMIPSVIQRVDSDYEPSDYTVELPFTRQNIYLRDGGICQYCGKKVSISKFTFDHIIPQADGGKTDWTNVVVSCTRCNSQKDCKALKRYHRTLIRNPQPLRVDKAAPRHIVGRLAASIPHKTWEDYIYWHVVLER